MYLNHQLVPGFPITLRYGEERDRDYLAEIFTEVWAEIPELDRTAILARGYGHITVDVLEMAGALHPVVEMGGDIGLIRAAVDTYPRDLAVLLVARQLAHKVDDFAHPKSLIRRKKPRHSTRQRVAAILERWGYTVRTEPEPVQDDDARMKSDPADVKSDESEGNSPG